MSVAKGNWFSNQDEVDTKIDGISSDGTTWVGDVTGDVTGAITLSTETNETDVLTGLEGAVRITGNATIPQPVASLIGRQVFICRGVTKGTNTVTTIDGDFAYDGSTGNTLTFGSSDTAQIVCIEYAADAYSWYVFSGTAVLSDV